MFRRRSLRLGAVSLICVLLFTAYSFPMHIEKPQGMTVAPGGMGATVAMDLGIQATFEILIETATHVVVAEFVEHRPFAERVSEYEFIVHERIHGDAADTIFVYVVYDEMHRRFASPEFRFTTGTEYLLPLTILADVYSRFREGGFIFTSDLILDLNNPSRSTLYNQPLTLHSNIDFDCARLTKEDIISYVRTLPRNAFATLCRIYITSDNLVDIIDGSPYVLVVEINELESPTNRMRTDIYYTTIVEVLKGDMQIGNILRVVFFAGTVFPGETHIVSITQTSPSSPNPHFHRFTSRNSLHSITQRDEILEIIATSASRPCIVLPPECILPTFNIPEDFISNMLQRDPNNEILLEEARWTTRSNFPTDMGAYVGNLDLTDEQLVSLAGFVLDPDTGQYVITRGGVDRRFNFFYAMFDTGDMEGIAGVVIYELPVPLLRFTIDHVRYYHNGIPLTSDVAPFISANRTMVPIRIISEALGAVPEWRAETSTAYIHRGFETLVIPVGQPLPGGLGIPEMQNDRVLVPARFVIEHFNAITLWDEALQEVTVYELRR